MDVKDPAFMGEISKQIDAISVALDRRMLVLCTSYKQTTALRQILEPVIIKDNRRLIVQKSGISRNLLVRQYLEHPHSILIGTSSFWEGVDFPGDKVEILCIIKTPFDNPFDPLIQSQIEDYTQHGENAFLQYQVPEAALKLRQGFGRLIRNMTDTGICILMDTRLCRRQYGKTILGSLPVEAVPYQHVGKLISDSQKFF
jgi:ATP-dependent DNA helicase DinG